jgi:hypothetical protein
VVSGDASPPGTTAGVRSRTPWSGSHAFPCQCTDARGQSNGSRRRGVRRWSRGDSNPGPPPCKGGALPAKLRPPMRSVVALSRPRRPHVVGAPGLEPGTSALSGPRSDHLSYAPPAPAPRVCPFLTGPLTESTRGRRRSAKSPHETGLLLPRAPGCRGGWLAATPPLPHRRASLPAPQPRQGEELGTGATTSGFSAAVLDLRIAHRSETP